MSCTDENCTRRIAALERENALLATDIDLVEQKAKQAFRAEQAAKNKLNGATRDDPNVPVIRDVVAHWKAVCNHPKAVVEPTADDDRWEAVRRRVGQFSVAELKQAINGAARFPYVVAKNRSATGSRKQRHDDLELICRNPRNVQKFMELALDDDGEPVEVAPNEPVVNASLFEEAIKEAAHHQRTAELLKDMLVCQDAYIQRLERELGIGVAA